MDVGEALRFRRAFEGPISAVAVAVGVAVDVDMAVDVDVVDVSLLIYNQCA